MMASLYPEVEPYDHGKLESGGGNALYWEACGNPKGRPALVVHGGPGSGCTPWWRRLFNPGAYRVILLDQRNCGRSTPHASEPGVDLANNNTQNLISDMELLRVNLGIHSWLLLGGSWGSVLSLAYSEAHPDRVSGMVLFGASSASRREEDWLFRGGLSLFFPEQWERLVEAIPQAMKRDDVVAAYHQLLYDPDPKVSERAARAWCEWESATPEWPPSWQVQNRFIDPRYALAYARLVTHYVHHHHFLNDGEILANASRLEGIPGVIVNGRFDFQGPIGNAWALSKIWPDAELVIVDNSGHNPDDVMTSELVHATDSFATTKAG